MSVFEPEIVRKLCANTLDPEDRKSFEAEWKENVSRHGFTHNIAAQLTVVGSPQSGSKSLGKLERE